jgi:type IV secretion system protein VirD4
MSETRETVEKLKQELQEVRVAAEANGFGTATASTTAQAPAKETKNQKLALSSRARGRAARAAAGGGESRHLSFELAGLGLKEIDRIELAAAVQTTKAIIAEYA